MKTFRQTVFALYQKYREQVNYLIVGGLTTLVSLGTYWLCTRTFLNPENPVQLLIANVISWICAVSFAYFANRRYVFFSQEQNRLKEAGAFFLSRLTTLGMETVIMEVGVAVLGLNDSAVKLAAQIIIIIANYVLSKLLVFRKKAR